MKCLLIPLLFAGALMAQGTPYDCFFVYSFTAATPQTGQSNASSQSPCVAWRVTYTTTGFSSVTVAFQTSSDNSSYSNVTNTQCSDSVRTSCVLEGASPITAGVQGNSAYRIYAKYVRVNVSSITGSGTGQAVVYGYKGTSASLVLPGSGGGGSGAVGNGLAGQTAAYLADGTTVNGTGNACVSASALGFQLDGSDETTLLNSTIASSTVSCLAIDGSKTLRADGQVLTSPTRSFRITGAASNGMTAATQGGSVLDLRYGGTSNGGAKLYAGGDLSANALLEIDHISIVDGATTCKPFIITSGASVNIHDTQFQGPWQAGCSDAIIQGFGGIFLGYGSRVVNNYFSYMARAYVGDSQPGWEVNGVLIEGNVIQGGNAATPVDAAIKFTGGGRANQVHNNLIELGGNGFAHQQTCGIFLTGAAIENSFSGNQAWDGSSDTYLFCGNATAVRNSIDKSNFVDVTGSLLVDSGWSSNNYMPWRTIPFGFDGGGSALSGTTSRCGLIPFGGYINQFSMQADQNGDATVTISTVALASYTGPGSASDISNGGESMSGAATKTDTTLTGWTRQIDPQTMVCVALSSPSTITWLSGSVQVWEGK